ncbi:Response regulator receiver domain-containing protein [Maribacter sedimenticola]|uniref:Response regulator receiver domain-containing protein n=1 Tax=Maribacter sedimenticola TaxID=228956 RepID=A0ABY1SGA8_9FLAO|nr:MULTISPECIES: response regulator [Maribacter]TVZ14377.1 response regulator receiver domain-containing protein [Maribacter sp. MAR_2009_72]SNR45050.1 Response regulator receiver domain-containing protein [Maribacter sedimenticola]
MKNLDRLNSILLVDDDEASNFLHSIFINKLDLDVNLNSALNGQEALDFILGKGQEELELPCMVMLDLRMPVMDGWQFMEAYEEMVPKKLKDQITIVLVTISDNQEDKDRAITNPHIADFSQKPLSDDTFKQLIQKHFSLAAI